jgi:hypothetical protein
MLSLDFVKGLLLSIKGHNKIFFITYKATKYIKYLVDKITFIAEH